MSDAIFSPSLESFRPNPVRMRVGVLASGSGSNFEALVEASRAGALNADVAVVVCNRANAGAIRRAARLGVPHVLIDHQAFSSRGAFDAAVADALHQHHVTWVAMAGWMRIATRVLLDEFPGRVLNVHPSLLPAFRGAHGVRDALASGVRVTGCTVHVVTESLDAGPIIAQAALAMSSEDDEESLTRKINALEHVIYPRALALAMSRED